MDPTVNIDVGAQILATLHGGSLVGYNGGPNAREHGYPAKVGAIMSALGGVEIRVKGHRMRELREANRSRRSKTPRMEKLTGQIAKGGEAVSERNVRRHPP